MDNNLPLVLNQIKGSVESVRSDTYTLGLRINFIYDLMISYGLTSQELIDKAWGQYVSTKVGLPDVAGKMTGSCKVTLYGC
jgi:hypothetical protein